MEAPSVAEEQVSSQNPIEKLHPVEFQDADGANRELFIFKDRQGNQIKVVFYTREELPFSQAIVAGNFPIILGEPPKHRDQEEWDEFVGSVKSASENHTPLDQNSFRLMEAKKAGNTLFFVENTPVHILDLAFHLGLGGSQWRNARQKAAFERIYTPEVIDLIDDCIAGTVVDDEGKVGKRKDQKGEALAILALLGDKEAREILDKKKDVITGLDEERDKRYKEFFEKRYEDLLKEGAAMPRGIQWATHVTSYKPQVTEQGVLLRSSFDGTNGAMTRNTIHFSLNGAISDAFGGGGWENMPFVISGNLSKIRDVNGNPVMINEIDTYFLVNPGQQLFIPDAQLTMPGHLPKGVIEKTKDGVRFYKAKDLTPEDIDTLFREHFDNYNGAMKKDIVDFFFRDKLAFWLNAREQQEEPSQEELIKIADFARLADIDTMLSIFSNLRTEGIEKTVRKLLDDVGTKIFNEKGIQNICRKVERWLVERIRNGTFWESTLRRSNSNSGANTMLLAASWGTKGSNRSQAHSEDVDGGRGLEFAAGRIFQALREHKEREERWKKEREERGIFNGLRPRLAYPYYGPVIGEDRKSIMGAFRNERISFLERGMIMRPENRRMFFVAGVV